MTTALALKALNRRLCHWGFAVLLALPMGAMGVTARSGSHVSIPPDFKQRCAHLIKEASERLQLCYRAGAAVLSGLLASSEHELSQESLANKIKEHNEKLISFNDGLVAANELVDEGGSIQALMKLIKEGQEKILAANPILASALLSAVNPTLSLSADNSTLESVLLSVGSNPALVSALVDNPKSAAAAAKLALALAVSNPTLASVPADNLTLVLVTDPTLAASSDDPQAALLLAAGKYTFLSFITSDLELLELMMGTTIQLANGPENLSQRERASLVNSIKMIEDYTS